MSSEHNVPSLFVTYDGSPDAARAISVAALLLPTAAPKIVHVWTPPFASDRLRRRLRARARTLDELSALVEQEGRDEAERVAADGVALAAAAGWRAEPLVHRGYGDIGFQIAELAERDRPAAVVVGARGLSGARALMGSVSDAVVHYSDVPVLVVAHPLLTGERRAVTSGPIVIGHDGSPGAERAAAQARELFPGRRRVVVAVGSADTADPEVLGDAFGDIVHVEAIGTVRSGRAIADALGAVAEDHDAAAVVVGSRGQSASREIFLGSVAMAALHHLHRPVMVVPEPRHREATA